MEAPSPSLPHSSPLDTISPAATATDPNPNATVLGIMNSFARDQLTFDEAALRLESLIGDPNSERKLRSFVGNSVGGPGGRRKPNRWSDDEDKRLIAAVQAHGTENWPFIANIVGGGRTRAQCAQRWNRGLDPKISKANWSQEEELRLLTAVETYGTKAWIKVAGEVGNRSDVQCRFRYSFLAKKAVEAGTPVQPISPPQAVLGGDAFVEA
jgi:hypothetical protein